MTGPGNSPHHPDRKLKKFPVFVDRSIDRWKYKGLSGFPIITELPQRNLLVLQFRRKVYLAERMVYPSVREPIEAEILWPNPASKVNGPCLEDRVLKTHIEKDDCLKSQNREPTI